jgi:hypothetical protein
MTAATADVAAYLAAVRSSPPYVELPLVVTPPLPAKRR